MRGGLGGGSVGIRRGGVRGVRWRGWVIMVLFEGFIGFSIH